MAKKAAKPKEDVEEKPIELSTLREVVGKEGSAFVNIVKPLVTPKQAKEAWKAYQDLCEAILEPSDYYKIPAFVNGKPKPKVAKLKSAWRKLATAFNLNVEIAKEEREVLPNYFLIRITARVTAPNGRIVEGLGSCASNERAFTHLEHDVRAMAETRAKNRAIADMIGGGEVSAEELQQMEGKKQDTCSKDHDKLPQKNVTSEGKNKGRPYAKCPVCTYFAWLDEGVTETKMGEDVLVDKV